VTSSFDPSPLASHIAADAELRDRDLGFGTVVSGTRARRLLNRDGSFNVVREGLGLLATLAPYHLLLTISWPGFIGIVTLLYLAVNLLFALLFLQFLLGSIFSIWTSASFNLSLEGRWFSLLLWMLATTLSILALFGGGRKSTTGPQVRS